MFQPRCSTKMKQQKPRGRAVPKGFQRIPRSKASVSLHPSLPNNVKHCDVFAGIQR
jgi:hypothetical protein